MYLPTYYPSIYIVSVCVYTLDQIRPLYLNVIRLRIRVLNTYMMILKHQWLESHELDIEQGTLNDKTQKQSQQSAVPSEMPPA